MKAGRDPWRERFGSVAPNRSSGYLLGAFALLALMIGYVWWPLARSYLSYLSHGGGSLLDRIDWLFIGIFTFMSLLFVFGADIGRDAVLFFVGLAGGCIIESWGTQTQLWTYFTQERPPPWILPAWGLANLSVFRLVRFVDILLPEERPALYRALYWIVFAVFLSFLFPFVRHTLDKPFTWGALLLVHFLVLTPTDHRMAVQIFLAGTGLGFFIELWGTTRHCWNYYTGQTPPAFSVMAHGLAAVAFWRAERYLRTLGGALLPFMRPTLKVDRHG